MGQAESSINNQIFISSLTIILIILLGIIYFNIVQVAPYAEVEGLDDFNRASVLDTTDSIKVVSREILLKPNTWYRLQFTVDSIEGPSPIDLHIDFYAGPSYDNPQQERNLILPNTTRSAERTVYLNSGDSPESAFIRFFYKSPSTISLSGISIGKATIPIREIRYAITIALVILLAFFLYKMRSNKVLFTGIILSLFVGAVSVMTFPPGSGDSMWNVPVGLSIIKEGNIDLNEYSELIELRNNYGIVYYENNYYNYFPVGGTIIPLPFIFIGHLLFGEDLLLIELFSSKLMFMLNVFLFYTLCWILSRNITISIILASIFAFATPNLHLLSGALWTHGSAELMITLTLLSLLYGGEKQNNIIVSFSAVFLFLGYLARPTTALLVPVVLLYLIFTRKRSVFFFVGLGSLCLGGYILWSMAVFGEPFPPYYASSRLSMDTFSLAIAGQLISPNRGLFVFVPFVFFSIAGMYKAIKDPNSDLIFKLLPLFVAAYAVVIAMFPHWWGGGSYGPRLYSDLMPIFVIYLYWVIKTFQKDDNKYWSYIFTFVVLICALIQSFAVIDPSQSVHSWNGYPMNVDENPGRIWDWSDMQILRIIPGLSRVESERPEHILNSKNINDNIFISNQQSSVISIYEGWHGLEDWDGTPARWMENDATLMIYSNDNRVVDLSFNAVSFYRPRSVEICVNDLLQMEAEVPSDRFVTTRLPGVSLKEGANIVRFHVPEGCERPADIKELNNPDSRCLSVAVRDIKTK